MSINKKIIVVVLTILFASSFAVGQSQKSNKNKIAINDCSNLISIDIDKVYGNSTAEGKKPIKALNDGSKTGFIIKLYKTSYREIILNIKVEGTESCIDNGSIIEVLFTDGSFLVMNNTTISNCKSSSIVLFSFQNRNIEKLEELKAKKIKTMRVNTNQGFLELDFTVENQDQFFNVINCLTHN